MWCDRLHHSSPSWHKSSKNDSISLKRRKELFKINSDALNSASELELINHNGFNSSKLVKNDVLRKSEAKCKTDLLNDGKSLAHVIQCAGKYCKCNALSRDKRKSIPSKLPKSVRKSFLAMIIPNYALNSILPSRRNVIKNQTPQSSFPFSIFSGLIKQAPKILSKFTSTGLRIKREEEEKSKEATFNERKLMMEGMIVHSTPKSTVLGGSSKSLFRIRRICKRNLSITQMKTVKVQLGDTLEAIANENGVPVRKLKQMNNLKNDSIYENDMLKVSEGIIKKEFNQLRPGIRRTNRLIFTRQMNSHVMGGGLVRRFGIGGPEPTSNSEPKTKTETATNKSKDTKSEVKWKKKGKGFPRQKQVIFAPPVADGFISSNFGWRWGTLHEGIDLAAEIGTPILASERGLVTYAGSSGGYGNLVTIQHNKNFFTRYAHCSVIHAKIGQYVSKGEQIAAVGSTGRSTGPHLHFEVRKNGEAVDPHKWTNL